MDEPRLAITATQRPRTVCDSREQVRVRARVGEWRCKCKGPTSASRRPQRTQITDVKLKPQAAAAAACMQVNSLTAHSVAQLRDRGADWTATRTFLKNRDQRLRQPAAGSGKPHWTVLGSELDIGAGHAPSCTLLQPSAPTHSGKRHASDFLPACKLHCRQFRVSFRNSPGGLAFSLGWLQYTVIHGSCVICNTRSPTTQAATYLPAHSLIETHEFLRIWHGA